MFEKKNYITLDTETANSSFDGKVDPNSALVYDIGWSVHGNYGEPIIERSFIVRDVFLLMADVMQSAYYSEKIPTYLQDIASGKRIVEDFFTIRKIFKADCELYNVQAIIAYNARFDYIALNATTRYLSKSRCRYWCYGVEWWDSMKMVNDTIAKQKKYKKFCQDNGYMTAHKKPRPQVKAEVVYKYMTNNHDFVEKHTALEDVQIEVEIYRFCRSKKMKMRRKLWND